MTSLTINLKRNPMIDLNDSQLRIVSSMAKEIYRCPASDLSEVQLNDLVIDVLDGAYPEGFN